MLALRRTYLWLLLCLTAQAALMTHRLDMLPMWNDELFTVQAAQKPVGAMFDMVRGDVHPPLYFLLAHYWTRLAPGNVLIHLRLLSVVFALLATIALDRLWLKHAPPRLRAWCLALWTFSACLLLYSRMARSYSLQVLGFIVVAWAVWRWSQEFASWKRLLIWAGSLAVLLYTHYVPGIAVWAGANLLLFRSARERPSRLLAGNLIVLAAYLPWLLTLASVLTVWRDKPGLLLLTRNSLLEAGVKLAYWVFSFFYGEAIPVWMLPVTALLAIPVAWLLWTGARVTRAWFLPAAVTALIGFAGVAGWVTYAFGPARLLFLLPLALLAIAAGAYRASRAGGMIAAAVLAANVIGISSYFQARDLLNIGYLAPMDRIAQDIVRSSSPADTLVLVDGPNLSGVVLEYYLPGFSTRQIFTEQDAESAWREVNNPAIRHVWFMRNPRDVTPGHVLEQMETDLRKSFSRQLHPYLYFSSTHKTLMRLMNVQVSSGLMYGAWEFRKPS
jgi:mannosyltransferase